MKLPLVLLFLTLILPLWTPVFAQRGSDFQDTPSSSTDSTDNPNKEDDEGDNCECEEDDGEESSQSDSSKESKQSLDWMVKVGAAPIPNPGRWTQVARSGIEKGTFMNRQQGFATFFNKHYRQDPVALRPVYLTFESPEIDSSLLDSRILRVRGPHAIERIFDDSGEKLSQVKTSTHLTDIEQLTNPQGQPASFHIRIWNLATIQHEKIAGRFVVTSGAAPVQEIILKEPAGGTNPAPGVFKMLKTDVERFGMGEPHVYTREYERMKDGSNDRLVVTRYEGPDNSGTVLRREELTYLNRGAKVWDYDIARTISEVTTNPDGTYGPLALITATYQSFKDYSVVNQPQPGNPNALGGQQGGRRLAYKIKDYGQPGSLNLRTDYTYYNGIVTPANGNQPPVYDPLLRGRLKSVVRYDQSWDYYEYEEGRNSPVSRTIHYSSFKDVTLADYQNGRKTVRTVLSDSHTSETSISGIVIAKKKVERLNTLNDNDISLIQISRSTGTEDAVSLAAFDNINRGRPLWKEMPDGTAMRYSYSEDSGNYIVTKEEGAGDREAITDGTRMVTTYNSSNQVIEERIYDIETDIEISSRVAFGPVDSQNRPMKFFYHGNLDDYTETRRTCCGVEFSRDRFGATKTFFRDALNRPYRVEARRSSTGPVVSTTTFYNGLTTRVERSSTAGTLLVNQSTRDLSGMNLTLLSPDANGDGSAEVTTISTLELPAGGKITSTTYPDATTSSRTTFIDGSTKSQIDQAGYETLYDLNPHSLNGGGLVRRTTYPGGSQWMESYQDRLGRTFQTLYPDGATEQVTFYSYQASAPAGSRGKMFSRQDADEVATPTSGSHVSYSYSADGEDITMTTRLAGGQQSVTLSTSDVLSSVTVKGTIIAPALRRTSTVNGIITSESFRSIDGRTSGGRSFGVVSISVTSLPADGTWQTVSTSPVGVRSVAYYRDGLMKSALSLEAGSAIPAPPSDFGTPIPGLITGSLSTQDAFGRTLTQTAARTGTTTMGAYLENGSVVSVTDPGGRTTSFTYDVMGRRLSVDAPDTLDHTGNTLANITYTSYTDRSQVSATWGDQTYPRRYQYDAQGRMTQLHTWQNPPAGEPTGSGDAVTEWIYDSLRGWLVEKNYHGEVGNGPGNTADYAYTAAGRLATRTWERGVSTTYSYDQGLLSAVNYSDLTPDLSYQYDQFGRMTNVVRAGSTHATYTFNQSNLLLDSELLNQDLPGSVVNLSRSFDSLRRLDGITVNAPGFDNFYGVTFTYEAQTGRLSQVSNDFSPGETFTYEYLATSGNLIEKVVGPAHTVENSYEPDRNVLLNKSNRAGQTLVSNFNYTVNALGQRTNVSRHGSAFPTAPLIDWSYNSRGELVAESFEPSHPDYEEGTSFSYDGIGNRIQSSRGANNLVSTSYGSNPLNQYTGIGNLVPSYDLDGNATAYPLPVEPQANSVLEWDGENRLSKLTRSDGTVTDYQYDYLSRRISKNIAQSGVDDVTETYVYDGWNTIIEARVQSGTTTELIRNHWGLDLSGSMQGAGGVGGLLSSHRGLITGTTTGLRGYPTYDGNGNVSEYLSDSGSVLAHYEYDPFGNIYRSSGVNKDDFGIRFSTKKRDEESGLYYYGYRYYDPQTGRWPSRDPIEEKGGSNLYRMVGNSAINWVDFLGLILLEFNAFIHKEIGEEIRYRVNNGPEQSGFFFDEPGSLLWYTDTDDRGFGGGSSRLKSVSANISIESIGNLEGSTYFESSAGESKRIQKQLLMGNSGPVYHVTEEARTTDDLSSNETVKDIDECTSEITVSASASYPFSALAPDIDYEVTFILRRVRKGKAFVSASGEHNKFPYYETLVNNMSYYQYSAKKEGHDGPGLINLNTSLDFNSEMGPLLSE